MKIRQGNLADLKQVKNLALTTWGQFENILTPDNWNKLYTSLTSDKVFADLLTHSDSFVCENEQNDIVGMSFLVPSGNPTEIFHDKQCYIRFVTVSTHYKGHNLGQKLTEKCIEKAKENNEKNIALHTSEFMNAARHIYEKLGFTITKELEPRLGKTYWLYELNL